jgi:hypothetical protein
MSRFRKWYPSVAAVVVLLSLCGVLLGDGTVCRKQRISGFDDLYAKAKRVIETPETTDLNGCEVYLDTSRQRRK